MSLLVVLCPIDEYHMYSRVNSFIYSMYSEYEEIWAIAPHALALAIILGCKTIYIGGVDIPIYAKDYVHYGSSPIVSVLKNIKYFGIKPSLKKIIDMALGLEGKSVFYPDISQILQDFDYLNNICENNNINLYNLSKESSLNKISGFTYLNPDEIKG